MAVSLRDTVKISEFIDLSKQDEILPAFMTKVKSVRISTVDKIMAVKNDSLSDVDLLKGVHLFLHHLCLLRLPQFSLLYLKHFLSPHRNQKFR